MTLKKLDKPITIKQDSTKQSSEEHVQRLNYFLVISLLYVTTTQPLFVDDKREVRVHSEKEESEISPTEDLMREHGILNRVLLIYEEIIKRIDNKAAFPLSVLGKAVEIIKVFIEDYHEKLEEDHIFPLFEKNKKEVRLIKILRNQHNQGREITAKLKKIISTKKSLGKKQKRMTKSLLQKFITMYRPHEAREDTVLFPKIRSLISKKEFEELGEAFEALEHKLFGEDGFESMVDKVAAIEKELGIYNLEQFTPIIGKT
jgi:hemerythrin-like domain-containing protein